MTTSRRARGDVVANIGPETFDRLRVCSTGTLTTQLLHRGFRQRFLVGVKPLNARAARFVGEAYTVRLIPAREDIDTFDALQRGDLQWTAVEEIPSGHVLMVDANKDVRAGVYGDMLLTRLWQRGAAAVVTDGAFRDGPAIASMEIPAYSATTTATSRLSFFHVADLQVPIGCMDVAVYPGDVVVGDLEGVVVIPRHLAVEIAIESEQQEELETYLLGRLAAGEPTAGLYPPSAVVLAEYDHHRGRPADDGRSVRK